MQKCYARQACLRNEMKSTHMLKRNTENKTPKYHGI